MVTINDVDRYRSAVDESVVEYRNVADMEERFEGEFTETMVSLQEAINIRLGYISAAFIEAEKWILYFERTCNAEGAERSLNNLYRTCNTQVYEIEDLKNQFWGCCYE